LQKHKKEVKRPQTQFVEIESCIEGSKDFLHFKWCSNVFHPTLQFGVVWLKSHEFREETFNVITIYTNMAAQSCMSGTNTSNREKTIQCD